MPIPLWVIPAASSDYLLHSPLVVYNTYAHLHSLMCWYAYVFVCVLHVNQNNTRTHTPSHTHTNVITNKDFGAIGDGKTKDTIAVRSAFAIARKSGGGVVYFPSNYVFLTAVHPHTHPPHLRGHCFVLLLFLFVFF